MYSAASFAYLLLLVGLTFAGAGTKQLRKQDLPGLIDVAPLFVPMVASMCKIEVSPVSAPLDAIPCSCGDVSKVIQPSSGPFALTTCFKITSLEAVTVQLRVTCVDKGLQLFQTSSLRLVITDTAPTCRNSTIAVAAGEATNFFLLASDPDDDFFEYHVRNASLSLLNGTLKYCVNCEQDSLQSGAEWKPYSEVLQSGFPHRFARMFSYTPPANVPSGWSETLSFTARDLSDQFCPNDGVVTFLVENPSPPIVSASRASAEVGRLVAVKIDANGNTSLQFTLTSISDCLRLCRLPEAARQVLRDFPGESLSGAILEPCDASNALRAGSDISILSSKPTFWATTFVVVKALRSCSQASFGVSASLHGKVSSPVLRTVDIIAKTRRCISYQHTFDPDTITRIPVEQFLSTNAGETVRLTTLTTGDFSLQLLGAPLRESAATAQSELAFRGTQSLDVAIYVKSSDNAELFCTLQLVRRGSTSPPPTTTSAPMPTTGSPTAAPTSQPFDTPGASSARTTFILVLAFSGLVLAYYFRAKIVRFFVGAPTPPRRYGVVAGDADE